MTMQPSIFCLGLLMILVNVVSANWGNPNSGQYHIQTDEGPERYFRYQTDNGQFRKEKRLQDGTVIGTNAWIDGFGYLRQSDYIADHEGYRILKSKTVFVGKDRPIEDAMKEAKKAPANSGTLVSNKTPSKFYVPATTRAPIAILTSTPSPIASTPYNPYSSFPRVQSVFIRPHGDPLQPAYLPPSSTPAPLNVKYLPANELENNFVHISSNDLQVAHQPADHFLPPHGSSDDTPEHLKPPLVIYGSSTPSPSKNEHLLPPLVAYPSSTVRPSYESNGISISSTVSPLNENRLDNDLLPPKQYPSYKVVPLPPSTIRPRYSTPQTFGDFIPVTHRPIYRVESSTVNSRPNIDPQQSYQYYNPNTNQISRSSPQYDRSKYYDGNSVTDNGFRYFLPRQYHEEDTNKDGSRDGSYGYIDPFGIRRVVYYNAGSNGFVHRKNNRYVGFSANPYDPRPN